MKKYIVTLAAEERQSLSDLIAAGKAAAQKLAHARILLKADQAEGGPAWPDHPIAEALEVSTATIERSARGSSSKGWRPPWSASPGAGPVVSGASTAGPRPGSSPGPAPHRPTAGRSGPCGSWPISWSSWRSSPPSPTERCGGL